MLKGGFVMGCCGGGYQPNNRKMKEWGDKNNKDNSSIKSNHMLLIVGLLLLGFVVYKFII